MNERLKGIFDAILMNIKEMDEDIDWWVQNLKRKADSLMLNTTEEDIEEYLTEKYR